MRIANVIQALVGASAVYVVMAACSAASSVPAGESSGAPPSATTSPSATPPGSASTASSGGSIVDAFVDALSDPVKEASAAPETAAETCDKSGGGSFYAEHLYPGATIIDLANVVVLTSSSANLLPGYSGGRVRASLVWLRDGAVAVPCTAGENVLFIRP